MPDRIHADVMAAALRYARRGWFVFPTKAGGKNPHKSAQYSNGRNWGMTVSEDEIRRDWTTFPDAGVALPTGRDSGFFVIDVDSPEGHAHDGVANFAAAQQQHGILPTTLTAKTPTGGTHYYFKYPAEGEVRCITDGSWIRGVDVKGRGGYVLAAPTVKVRDGVEVGCYEWITRPEVTDMAEAPRWVMDAVTVRPRERTSENEARANRSTVSIGDIRRIMQVIPNEDREWGDWNKIAMALHRASGGCEEGLDIFAEWCAKSAKCGVQETPEQTWRRIASCPPSQLSVGTLIREADIADPSWKRDRAITVEDFFAFLPERNYIFEPTNRRWVKGGVDAQLRPIPLVDAVGRAIVDANGVQKKQKASEWLALNRPIHEIGWAPGEGKVIADKVVSSEGWKEKPGSRTLNMYHGPSIILGRSRQAGTWLGHVDALLGEHRDHVLSWMAFKVQHPDKKINHALVLGGPPGIGKDTMLEPLREAVGVGNFKEASPHTIMDRFNPSLRGVIVKINEARDLGEINRYQFYERMKIYIAAPPPVVEINEKFINPYFIPNIVGVIFTTNYRHNGLYLPNDDRRHYVVWSECVKEDFHPDYFDQLYEWFENDGYCHVAAYLHEYNLSQFNPAEPPIRTEAFLTMVEGGTTSEEDETSDLLEHRGSPDAFAMVELKDWAQQSAPALFEWLNNGRNNRVVPHRMEAIGYTPVRNPTDGKGKWITGGKRTTMYAKSSFSLNERIARCREVKVRLDGVASRGGRVGPSPDPPM